MSVPAEDQLTPGRAVAIGVLCAACGVPPVLGSLGVIPIHPDPGVPAWIGIAAGSLFLLAALLLFVDAAAGGVETDGSLPADAPPALRALQSILGLTIVVVMGAVITWVAVGKGERHFSMTMSLPFIAYRPKHPELPGRIAFGVGAAMIWIMAIAGTAAALKKHIARLRSA